MPQSVDDVIGVLTLAFFGAMLIAVFCVGLSQFVGDSGGNAP